MAREILGTSLRTDHFLDELTQYAVLGPVQETVAILVEHVKLPVDDAPLHRLGNPVELGERRTWFFIIIIIPGTRRN